MATLSAELATVEIKGASYGVEVIPAGEFGLSAVRLTKLVNGETYDVVLEDRTHASCDCPDFELRRKGTGQNCKHGAGLIAAGLLVPPICGGEAPAVASAPAPARVIPAPVTPADLKRARFFGLTIPTPAPAPAPTVEVPAPVAELAPEIPAENPRDSWGDWTDELSWTISEAPGINLAGFRGFDEAPAEAITPARVDGELATPPADFPPAVAPMAWVKRGACWSLENTTPVRVDTPARRPARFEPTPEDRAAAAAMFADLTTPDAIAPPLGDRSYPSKPRRPRYTGTGMSDFDVYPRPGSWS